MLEIRPHFYQFTIDIIGTEVNKIKNLKEVNFLIGSFTTTSNSIPTPFITVAGKNSIIKQLIANGHTHYLDPNGINRLLIPEANLQPCFIGDVFDPTKRFLEPKINFRQFDTEPKILEWKINDIAESKSISIPQGAVKRDYLDGINGVQEKILEGENLQIIMRSELESCSSCTSVLEEFNSANIPFTTNSAKVDFIGGLKFYDPQN